MIEDPTLDVQENVPSAVCDTPFILLECQKKLKVEAFVTDYLEIN
jgi:hypothetical protein